MPGRLWPFSRAVPVSLKWSECLLSLLLSGDVEQGDQRITDWFGLERAPKIIGFLKQDGLGLRHKSCCPRAKTFCLKLIHAEISREDWSETEQSKQKSNCRKWKASSFWGLGFYCSNQPPLTGKCFSLSGNKLGDEGCSCLLENLPCISISKQLK